MSTRLFANLCCAGRHGSGGAQRDENPSIAREKCRSEEVRRPETTDLWPEFAGENTATFEDPWNDVPAAHSDLTPATTTRLRGNTPATTDSISIYHICLTISTFIISVTQLQEESSSSPPHPRFSPDKRCLGPCLASERGRSAPGPTCPQRRQYEQDQLQPIGKTEVLIHMIDLCTHRTGPDVQRTGDFHVGLAPEKESHDVRLLTGQAQNLPKLLPFPL